MDALLKLILVITLTVVLRVSCLRGTCIDVNASSVRMHCKSCQIN